jgi:hypothetical protein
VLGFVFPVIFEPSLRLYFPRKLFIAALLGGKKCTGSAASKQWPKPAEPEPKFLPVGNMTLRQTEFPSAPV